MRLTGFRVALILFALSFVVSLCVIFYPHLWDEKEVLRKVQEEIAHERELSNASH